MIVQLVSSIRWYGCRWVKVCCELDICFVCVVLVKLVGQVYRIVGMCWFCLQFGGVYRVNDRFMLLVCLQVISCFLIWCIFGVGLISLVSIVVVDVNCVLLVFVLVIVLFCWWMKVFGGLIIDWCQVRQWFGVLLKLRNCLQVLVLLWNRCLFFSVFRLRWFRNGWLFCDDVLWLFRNMWLLF